MADLPVGEPEVGGYIRGYRISDVREAMGIYVPKAQAGDGNPNSEANRYLTREEKLALFFQFLQENGVAMEEFETVFESRRDQGDEINNLNLRGGNVLEEWAGVRREFYYLMWLLKNEKKVGAAQIRGDMKSILNTIEALKDQFTQITKSIKSLHGTPLRFPDVFKKKMDFVQVGKKGKKARK